MRTLRILPILLVALLLSAVIRPAVAQQYTEPGVCILDSTESSATLDIAAAIAAVNGTTAAVEATNIARLRYGINITVFETNPTTQTFTFSSPLTTYTLTLNVSSLQNVHLSSIRFRLGSTALAVGDVDGSTALKTGNTLSCGGSKLYNSQEYVIRQRYFAFARDYGAPTVRVTFRRIN